MVIAATRQRRQVLQIYWCEEDSDAVEPAQCAMRANAFQPQDFGIAPFVLITLAPSAPFANAMKAWTDGDALALMTRKTSRNNRYVPVATLASVGAIPSSDRAVILPPLWSATVVVDMPTAPTVVASSRAISPPR